MFFSSLRKLASPCVIFFSVHVHTFPHKRQTETNFGTLILQAAL